MLDSKKTKPIDEIANLCNHNYLVIKLPKTPSMKKGLYLFKEGWCVAVLMKLFLNCAVAFTPANLGYFSFFTALYVIPKLFKKEIKQITS